ncbi:MAG: hypothetical protein EON54_08640 [Alcaligenaceae bacterium]|nr:MAG: hypothetical protein EON54_08640 [Alcaligenaceae bacterium]
MLVYSKNQEKTGYPTVDEIGAGIDAFFDIWHGAKGEGMLPRRPVLIHNGSDRVWADSQHLLMDPLPDLVPVRGLEVMWHMEPPYVGDPQWVWWGVRKLPGKPEGYWSPIPGGLHFEVNSRVFFPFHPDLERVHFRYVFVLDKKTLKLHQTHYAKHWTGKGKFPLPIEMAQRETARTAFKQPIEIPFVTASAHEDVRRRGVLTADASFSSCSVTVAVPFGEHKEIFALREAPLTPAGRRKAIIHWVAQHLRHRAEAVSVIPQHLRGVREIEIDEMYVRLTPNL